MKFVGDSAESETGVADGAEVTVEVSDEEKRLEDCAEGEGEGEYGSGEETLELEYWDSLYEANAEEGESSVLPKDLHCACRWSGAILTSKCCSRRDEQRVSA